MHVFRTVATLCFILALTATASAQSLKLTKGMVISKSVVVKKGSYQLSAGRDWNDVVLRIEGNNITVNFDQAEIRGSMENDKPDQFTGLGILVTGNNITIKNLKVRGYKVALMARNADGLKIENCDFSYNYRQHLNSTQEKEDISDWMSYHQNEKDEWLRYGAAIYLSGCNNAVISNTKVTGGQNALMIVRCNNTMIFNNDFSFNSGIGIGLYRSSHNKVLYNKIDFNVRGYSHGVYNRGQDSAGILVYEQSSNNLFYKNSVTHGGDGFFLWAGQTTMDTGSGGCNDNLLLRNDFSYAPTNGIEVTFSRNQMIHNRIFDCDHGIWGGYSFDSRISDNHFRDNRIGIAIEHGQRNTINHNLFSKDKEAIRLWARASQPSDWVYAQKRDTRSHNYIIAANSFNEHQTAVNITRTDSIWLYGNSFQRTGTNVKVNSTVTRLDSTEGGEAIYGLSKEENYLIPDVKKPMDPFRGAGKLAGRKNILVNEWGPYNFQYPIIWNANPVDTSDTMKFDLRAPAGTWKILSFKGVEQVSKKQGSFPDSFQAVKIKPGKTDIEIVAAYRGPTFTDQFGNKMSSGKPHLFLFKKFFQPINFTVYFFDFDSVQNPLKPGNIALLEKQQPFKTEKVSKLDYAWWGGIKAGEQQHTQFLTLAEGDAELEPGTYEISVTWDDAVRVYIDDKLVLDEWNPASYKFDESPNKKIRIKLGGLHHFRVEHVELGGFATLSLKLNKG